MNNAALDDFVPLNQITEEHFHSHFDVNVLGMLLAVKYMEKNSGCILNISSLSSTHPAAGSAVYGGSKAAVDAINATLALELGPNGIRSRTLLKRSLAKNARRSKTVKLGLLQREKRPDSTPVSQILL